MKGKNCATSFVLNNYVFILYVSLQVTLYTCSQVLLAMNESLASNIKGI